MLNDTWVHACALELFRNTLVRVAPEVLRISASSQSQMQPEPEHRPSVVLGQYQKVSVDEPAGTTIVWLTQLSPKGSGPDTRPSSADCVPLCDFAVVTTGGI